MEQRLGAIVQGINLKAKGLSDSLSYESYDQTRP